MRPIPGRILAPLALCALAAGAFGALRQDQWTPAGPGTQHELLKKQVGVWDAKVTFHMGDTPMTNDGTETNTLACGGKALESRFKGTFMGLPFEGVGLTTWDANKEAYVGVWTDSMSEGMTIMSGQWSEADGALVFTFKETMAGQEWNARDVHTYTDADHRATKMHRAVEGEDEEHVAMEIEYTRRPAR